MDLWCEIAAEGGGLIPDIATDKLMQLIPLLAVRDHLILEDKTKHIQTRCEAEGKYRLEYFDDRDGLAYVSEPELVGRAEVTSAFQAFADGTVNLKEHAHRVGVNWRVNPDQPRPVGKPDPPSAGHCNGLEFEEFVSKILRERGWTTQLTKKSGDQGLDVLAWNEHFRVALQRKRYSYPVGNDAVQQAHAAADYLGATHAAVVTTSSFTTSARQLAETLGVLLLNEATLSDLSSHLVFVPPRSGRGRTASLFRA